MGHTKVSVKSNEVLFLAAGVSMLFQRALPMFWWARTEGWKQSNWKSSRRNNITDVPHNNKTDWQFENVNIVNSRTCRWTYIRKKINCKIIRLGIWEERLYYCCKVIVFLLGIFQGHLYIESRLISHHAFINALQTKIIHELTQTNCYCSFMLCWINAECTLPYTYLSSSFVVLLSQYIQFQPVAHFEQMITYYIYMYRTDNTSLSLSPSSPSKNAQRHSIGSSRWTSLQCCDLSESL